LDSFIVLSRLKSPLSKDKTRRDGSLILMIRHYTVIKTIFTYFRVWMVAVVTEQVIYFIVWDSQLV